LVKWAGHVFLHWWQSGWWLVPGWRIFAPNFVLQLGTGKYFDMKKTLWVCTGFLMFIIGFTALVLSLVGIRLSYLTWIDAPGGLFGFLVRILMIIVGVVIVYLTVTDWRNQDDD